MIYIETSRLILRDWKKSDKEAFRKLNSDERVMKYFPEVLSPEETDDFYNAIQEELENYKFGLYAVELKENKEFIGFIGFHKAVFASDFTPCIEIGWRLKKDAWSKGYATEGAKACIEYGFNELDIEEIYSFAAVINKSSQNVMKKIGLRYIKDFNHPRIETTSVLRHHVLYKISKDEIY